MVGSGVAAGGDTRVHFDWEDTFATEPSTYDEKVPGYETTLDSAEGRKALQQVFQPGNRTPIDILELVFDGSWTLSFLLSDPWFFRALFGSPSQTDNGDGTYTYTYNNPEADSFFIVDGREGASAERGLAGCVVTQISIDTTVDQGVQVTMSGAYANETTDLNATLTGQPTPDASDALTFVDADLVIDGSSQGYVQNMTLNLQTNIQLVREMGTDTAIDYVDLEVTGDLSFGQLHDESMETLQDFYGGDGASDTSPQDDRGAGVEVIPTFDNGVAAGSGQNVIKPKVTGTLLENYDPSGIGDPRSPIEESLNRIGLDVSATATNEVSSEP